ncbi:MAG: TetR family transcriptional regulator [Rhodoferax sp.]|jgi:AcrR family transcriptional regulator|nr:TetR family transcriptional regulator [Rhodoferax sp.]
MNQSVHTRAPTTRKPIRAADTVLARKRMPAEPRTNDPERTKAEILRAAVVEFGEKGLAGARIDEIAAATHTSKRMIYYYFGSKDGLYLAALEQSYARVRDSELQLRLDDMDPETALRCLVTVMFDHHLDNEHYIRIVMSENINRGRYLRQSSQIQELNRPAITLLRGIYDRGVAAGLFRPGLDATDIHASISALSFFNVSNRHTFGLIFQQDNQSPAYQAHRRENIVQMILRYVRSP